MNNYKINQDFILLIMNCKKYTYKAEIQKKTWLTNIPYNLYYHVIGDPELKHNHIFDNQERILWVKTGDDYNSLPKKVITAYAAVNSTFNYKYIFKTDDDQILIKPGFFEITQKLITNMIDPPHYGGYIVKVDKPYLSQYYKIHPELPKFLPILETKYCSGRFYFLSKSSVENLLFNKENIKKEYLEDYAIGFYLDAKWKANIFNIDTNKVFIDIDKSEYSHMLRDNVL